MTTVFMSMATRLSDLDDFEPETKIQTEGHTLIPTGDQNGPKDPDVLGSAPSCSPSQSLARKPAPDWPEAGYCVEIQVVSMEDDRVIPPPSHTWQVLIVEDMVYEGRPGLPEAVVTGPGWAVLFYGCHSLGEGLNLGEARDATFTLSGITVWVGKQAQISAKPISLGLGRWLITQAVTEGHIKPFHLCLCHSVSNQDMSALPPNLPVNAE